LLAAVVVLPFAFRVSRASSPMYSISREQVQWMFVAGFILFIEVRYNNWA
jgi:hypothetical protein